MKSVQVLGLPRGVSRTKMTYAFRRFPYSSDAHGERSDRVFGVLGCHGETVGSPKCRV